MTVQTIQIQLTQLPDVDLTDKGIIKCRIGQSPNSAIKEEIEKIIESQMEFDKLYVVNAVYARYTDRARSKIGRKDTTYIVKKWNYDYSGKDNVAFRYSIYPTSVLGYTSSLFKSENEKTENKL